jgi:hypothetical protein
MIKRFTRAGALDLLSENPTWNVVDVACGATAGIERANTLVDIHDWSEKYPDKNFIVHDAENPLPFSDKEFDFVFASHILEHVKDPVLFCSELCRIGKRGYIEVPTPLIDNLVSGDDRSPLGHKWWIFFDDVYQQIIFRPKREIVHRTVEIPELNVLYPFFRESFVIELYWDSNIDIARGQEKYSYEGKEYDLSKNVIQPWVMGSSVLSKQENNS